MRILKRLFVHKKIKQLIDIIANTDDYPKNLDVKRGNEEVIELALDQGLIEEYMQSSGIVVGDTHFKHPAYRLKSRGKTLALSARDKQELKSRTNKALAWILGVAGTVLAGLILYSFGIGR